MWGHVDTCVAHLGDLSVVHTIPDVIGVLYVAVVMS